MRYLIQVLLLALRVRRRGRCADLRNRSHRAREALLGVGDVVRITVYQNPDLTVEARVSEHGQINFPLIGDVADRRPLGRRRRRRDREALRDGGFVLQAAGDDPDDADPQQPDLDPRPGRQARALSDRDRRQQGLGDDRRGRRRRSRAAPTSSRWSATATASPIKLDIDLPADPAARPRRPRHAGRERRHHLRRPGADVLHVRRGPAARAAAPRARHDADAGAGAEPAD